MIKQLLQFAQNHWMLCSGFAAVLVLLIYEEIRGKISGIPRISAQDTALLLNRENTVVIDLRSQNAFTSGHILSAINIASTDIDQNLKKLEAHKNKAVILVDDSDTKALPTGSKLRTLGFVNIHVLAGGLSAWQDAHLPLSKN